MLSALQSSAFDAVNDSRLDSTDCIHGWKHCTLKKGRRYSNPEIVVLCAAALPGPMRGWSRMYAASGGLDSGDGIEEWVRGLKCGSQSA